MRFPLISLLFLIQFYFVSAQNKKYAVYGVAFYNVENLFDTIDSENTNDEEFTPKGRKQWNKTKYNNKLENLSAVLNQLGESYCPKGPAVIGLAEVENRKVLEDLIQTGTFSKKNYQIVHRDSPDKRGIDVALLYNPELFELESYRAVPFTLASDTSFKTRDQLLVSGKIANEKVHFIVNHWPSRRAKSVVREQAAALTKTIVDSLQNIEKNARIIVLGDFNDDPTNASLKTVLKAKRKQADVDVNDMYNPFWDYYARGIGSLGYKGSWNLFDQIILSKGLLGEKQSQLVYWKAEIFNKNFLINQEGQFKGYPKRTHSKGIYLNGYSDHLPVLLYLTKPVESSAKLIIRD